MSRALLLTCVTAVLVCIPSPSFAQAPQKPQNLGNRPWVVIKGDLRDFSGRGDKIIADFDTEQEAARFNRECNENEREWARWTYNYTKRPQNDQPQRPIELPDPGKNTTVQAPRAPMERVAGRSATGSIGKSHVHMSFQGEGEKGDFYVSGQLRGQGTWTQTEDGLLMETARARFRGTIRDGEIRGLRFMKDGSEPLTEWSMRVDQPRQPAQPTAPSASTYVQRPQVISPPPVRNDTDSILGTWTYSKGGRQAQFEIRAEGQMTIKLDGNSQPNARWSMTGPGSFRVLWNGTGNPEDFTKSGNGFDGSKGGRLTR